MKRFSKTQAKEEIKRFFSYIKEKDTREIKKMKKLAMSHNIPLKEKRKTFCKKCLHPYNKSRIRIKKNIKSITCEHCDHTSRWKLK